MPNPTDKTIIDIEKLAIKIRESIIDMLVEAGSGHSAGSLGTADILATLYSYIMNINPHKPNDPNRDRFVLSNGHVCPVLYATLAHTGFFDKKELWTLRKINSRLQGHPHNKALPGIEASTGALGQGLSQAIGMALAAKMNNKSYITYCMTGDGELQEGQIWEAAMFAGKNRLDNLVWIIDRNNIQIEGHTEEVMPLENLKHKLDAFNWYTLDIDGHNIAEIISACEMSRAVTMRPTAIIAHTIPGKGVKFMQYKVEWHGKPPNKEEGKIALRELRSLEGRLEYE